MAIIHIIRTPATPEQIAEMRQVFDFFIKMIDETTLKERYLRDAVPTRLGNLASSIKRLGYFIGKKKYDSPVQDLLHECRLFSEWAAPDAEFETHTALASLQLDLKN